MAKILSIKSRHLPSEIEKEAEKEGFLKKLLSNFNSLDKFTKAFLIIVVIFILTASIAAKIIFDIRQRAQISNYFPIGVFETGGLMGDTTTMINDLKAHNLDSVMFNNIGINSADAILNVSDSLNFNTVVSFDSTLWNTWWPDTVPATIANAESAIGPLVDKVKNHPSLRGYNVVDEPGLNMKDKLSLAIQVFKNHDSVHPAAPVLIDQNIIPTLFDYSNPDTMLLDVYPVSARSVPCDMRINGGLDIVEYIRRASATRPANKPLWFILQTHSVGDGTQDWHLRTPLPQEVRMQNWLALGEGGTGIFWFIYSTSTDPTQNWIGLKDNPALYTEVSDLARRTASFKAIFLNAHKVADQITADPNSPTYTSTLASNDGTKNYVIAVNRSCADTTLTLKPYSVSGQLKDLENGQIYSLNNPIPFRAGDGKLFEILSSNAVTPLPTGQNLVKNNSFETNGWANFPDLWSRQTVGSFDNTVAKTGMASLKVQGAIDNYSDQTATLKPNTFYTLAGFVKTQNVTGQGIGLRYVQTSPAIEVINKTPMINGTANWTEIKTSFTTPAAYVNGKIDILMSLNSADTAWIDDVTLCEGTGPCGNISQPTVTNTPISIPTNSPIPTPTLSPVQNYGGITGTVYSSAGGIIPKAKITIKVGRTSKTYYSNSSGTYSITNLPAGIYFLTFQLKGYASQTVSTTVAANSTTTKNVTLFKK